MTRRPSWSSRDRLIEAAIDLIRAFREAGRWLAKLGRR